MVPIPARAAVLRLPLAIALLVAGVPAPGDADAHPRPATGPDGPAVGPPAVVPATPQAVTPWDTVPAVRAARRRGHVEVDGRLREDAWDRAPAADGFVQARPREGADPARPTRVRVLFDDEALWVGARMRDDPDAVRDRLVRRDGTGPFDWFRVELDPNGDRLTGYLFQVGASGTRRDAFLHDDDRVDDGFDAAWSAAVRRDSAGWTAEMRIPLSQIDFSTAESARPWGVNFVRRRVASDSESMLVLRSRTRAGRVSQFGRLEGVRIDGQARSLELQPDVSLRGRSADARPGDPFFDGTSLSPRLGLDASYNLSSEFTLDATLNPSFGQVEVDPAVVDLTAFETFFPEKRPFFTDDARIFDFALSGASRRLFHSRRIGREPRGTAPDGAEFGDVPTETSILGAAKATGRTSGGLSVGALGALTAREKGRAAFGDGEVEEFVAEPGAAHGLLRARQDLRDGASRVGAILAGVRREIPSSGRLDHLLRTSLAGGIDVEHQWGGGRDRRYGLWGYLSGSLIEGAPEALVEVQTDANHRFQRPDADYKSVDSTATRMVGREWRLQVERRSGEHWTWAAWANEVSPGYVVDDVGFAGRTLPRIDVGGRVRYQDITPGPLFRSWSLTFDTFHNFRHSLLDDPLSPGRWARSRNGGRFLLSGDFEFESSWRLRAGAAWAPEADTERETRGGPLMTDPASVTVNAGLSTDPRSAVSADVDVAVADRLGAGGTARAVARLELRPSSRWRVRVGPAYEHVDDRAQFVADTDAVPYPPTFGRRYLFADVTRRELSLVTRLDVAFTPRLSLQLFAQPLLSSADFTAYKQLRRSRSFAFRRFEEGKATRGSGGTVACRGGSTCVLDGARHVDLDGDGASDVSFADRGFSLGSLRANAVLRWEFGPGSELFLVWQQTREHRRRAGPFDADRTLDGLLGAPADDRVILKVRPRISF